MCINYRNARDKAEALAAELEASGSRAIAVAGDVSVEADVVRLFEACDERLGPLDGLVNNAGILETQMRVESMTADRIQRIFATNVTGAFVCAREAVRRMATSRGGVAARLSTSRLAPHASDRLVSMWTTRRRRGRSTR